MKLRKLKASDAEYMLEWMHDPDVVKDMQANFASKTIDDCRAFIESAGKDPENVHLAIVDDNDEYQGTVSLKSIHDHTAEFAITIRRKAMGKGISAWGMKEIIRYGKEELGLRTVYWCVNAVNKRAVRFYDKNGYQRIQIRNHELIKEVEKGGHYTDEQIDRYYWYIA